MPSLVRHTDPQCRIFLMRSRSSHGTTSLEAPVELASGTRGVRRSDVVECTVTKTISEPTGSFSFLLLPGSSGSPIDYLNEIHTGDWVEIWMTDGVTPYRMVMFGNVDRASRVRQVGARHEVTERVQVSGRDFGKVLIKAQTYFEAIPGGVEQTLVLAEIWRKLNNLSATASPGLLIKDILSVFSGGSGTLPPQFVYPPTGESFFKQISTTLIDTTRELGFNVTPYLGISGSDLWTMMSQYAHRLVNLFYVDTINRQQARQLLPTAPAIPTRDLNEGDASDDVRYLQAVLQDLGYLPRNPTGNFDKITSKAVLDYKKKKGLAIGTQAGNTVVDKSTWAAIQEDDRGTIKDPRLEPGVGIGFTKGQEGEYLAAVILKRLPYDEESFSKLPTFNIYSTDIGSEDLGTSDHEIFNWFRVTGEDLGVGQQPIEIVMSEIGGVFANISSIARHGIQRFDQVTPYAEPRLGGKDPLTIMRDYGLMLARWYNENEALLSGSIQIRRLFPEARAGFRCVRIDRQTGEALHFFTEGVIHHFSYPGPSITELAVSRGRNPASWPVRSRELFEELNLSPRDRIRLRELGLITGNWLESQRQQLVVPIEATGAVLV